MNLCKFSDDYTLLEGPEVFKYGGDEVLMDVGLFDTLRVGHGYPDLTLKLSKGHYKPKPSKEVLSNTVAIPDFIQGEQLLILDRRQGSEVHKLF